MITERVDGDAPEAARHPRVSFGAGMNFTTTYGVIAGSISLIIGIVLLFFKKLDSILVNTDWTEKDIRSGRLSLSLMFIIGGLMSISAVLLGWPPIRGHF